MLKFDIWTWSQAPGLKCGTKCIEPNVEVHGKEMKIEMARVVNSTYILSSQSVLIPVGIQEDWPSGRKRLKLG